VSVTHILKMHVRPRSQNPWQLASPLSSEVVSGREVPVVGVDDDGGVVFLAAVPARQLTLENILGSRSTRHGENTVAHRCLHSSVTSSCRMCTKPPLLHNRVCSTVILAPQPSQMLGISSREWLYRSLTLSLHSSADRPVPFNRKPCASGTVLFVPSRHRQFVLASTVEEDLLILELILLSHQACLNGAGAMSPQVKSKLVIQKGCQQVASSHKQGPVYTRSSVRRVKDCQPTQPDAVGEKLAVFTINLS